MVPVIVALDPGGTTGCAIRFDDGSIETAPYESHEEVYDLLASNSERIQFVVYERFAAQRIDRHGLHTVRVIGGIEAICHVFQISVTQHTPSHRLSFIVPAKALLARRGRAITIHEIDALAHLLAFEYDNANSGVVRP